MIKPTIRIHNIETNEVIDRKMTDLEFEEYQKEQEKWKTFLNETQLKKVERQAILSKLGISEEEMRLLLS
jgi:hypothetical protein